MSENTDKLTEELEARLLAANDENVRLINELTEVEVEKENALVQYEDSRRRWREADEENERLKAEHASIADVEMVPAVRYDEVIAERDRLQEALKTKRSECKLLARAEDELRSECDMLRERLEHELQLRAESDAVALKYQARLRELENRA